MSTISKPVAFIIGYGSNVGTAIARKFKSEGFNVAVSARTLDENAAKEEGYLGIRTDFGDIASVRNAFDRLESELGPAAAVIYNAYSANNGSPSDPLANEYETFLNNVNVSGVNVYEVARRTKAGFEKLPAETPRAFIATGNLQPWINFPGMLGMSVGKRALANIVEASAGAYGPQGHRFYFAHEVKGATGGPQVPPTGQAHADVFYRVWKQKEQGPWEVCFTETGALSLRNSNPTTSTPKPVAFVIGYGPNVGAAIARKFKSEGFDVAVSARKLDENAVKEDGYLGIPADFGDIASVRNAFDRLESELGPAAANIYNAYSASNTTDDDPLANPYETFFKNVTVTGVNLYEVARRAKAGFEKLPSDTPRALIGTGNLQPWITFPFALGMSVGKRAMANIVEASAAAYGPRGYR